MPVWFLDHCSCGISRYTLDNWATCCTAECSFVSTVDSTSDRFTASIGVSDANTFCMHFALQYEVDGREYWANNSGRNFQIDATPRSAACTLASKATMMMARAICRPILRTASLPVSA